MCLLKSDEWAYEQEWRIVLPTGATHANVEQLMPKPASIILITYRIFRTFRVGGFFSNEEGAIG
jgi:hypothetical protein